MTLPNMENKNNAALTRDYTTVGSQPMACGYVRCPVTQAYSSCAVELDYQLYSPVRLHTNALFTFQSISRPQKQISRRTT